MVARRNDNGRFGALEWRHLANSQRSVVKEGVIMARERLVVIGGDAAGMSAASQARRRRADLEIIAFERSPHTSYSA
jgi:succinate dehydrogenase/fumarate reductase flavoprotein subunit